VAHKFQIVKGALVVLVSVFNNGNKVTQLGDRVDSLTSALMGILVENTNNRSMLCWISPATVQMGICVRVLSAMPVTLAVKMVSERTALSEPLRPPLAPL
jgi:hypothetical protein